MDYFLQQLLNGISLGAIYGLIAIGYTMVYGLLGMINFAHGDVYMLGAFFTLMALSAMGMLGLTFLPVALLLVLLLAIAFAAAWGLAIERLAYRPLRHSFRLAPLISAIGVSLVLQNLVQIWQGARVKTAAPIIEGHVTLFTSNAGVAVNLSYVQISILVLTAVLLAGLTFLVTRTALGRQLRACEQDQTMAALLGVPVQRVIAITFAIGAALAAVAGFMVVMYYGVVDFFIGFQAGIKAFTAAVLGGIGSLPGAVLGGLIIGLLETFWSGYFSVQYKDIATFAVLILVLLFRPYGLFGRREVEKV